MKPEIHPKYYYATVTCACGNTFEVGSTRENLRVELCSACHPFFTGKKKIVDTAGRVERFKRRYSKSTGKYKVAEEETSEESNSEVTNSEESKGE